MLRCVVMLGRVGQEYAAFVLFKANGNAINNYRIGTIWASAAAAVIDLLQADKIQSGILEDLPIVNHCRP